MSGLLLDSNVISELRKPNSKRNAAVSKWSEQVDFRNVYLSVITIYEIEIGILRLERHDFKQAKLLRKWLQENILNTYHGRILSIDSEVAQGAASIQVPNPHQAPDAFIAATALKHKLTLATRNVSDFLDTSVQLVNPWEPGITYASVISL